MVHWLDQVAVEARLLGFAAVCILSPPREGDQDYSVFNDCSRIFRQAS
jgi:hypothetical protein